MDKSVAARRLPRRTLAIAAALVVFAGLLVANLGDALAGGAKAQAAANHTVTFANDSGEKIWIGSTVNADGSENFGSLPILEPGQRASIVIPETSGPGHWRGKFFARQRCTGEPGSTFHCAVGDCGNAMDHCAINSERPASLAEFNFDPSDPYGSPWYNISYVNAVSLPITITPTGGPAPVPNSQHCGEAGCAKPFLKVCPEGNLIRDDQGQPLNCINPNRDAETDYSRALNGECPKAYSWSKQDAVIGNQTMFQCKECSGFTITFHGNGTAPAQAVVPPAVVPPVKKPPVAQYSGERTAVSSAIVNDWQGKCLDVRNGNLSDGIPLQVSACNGSRGQRWTFAGGSLRTEGKLCMDVAWGSRDNGAVVQIANCSGNPAQQWVLSSAGDLVNPQANKCLDIKDWNAADGAPLQIWECAGSVNQKWHTA
ncbi:thaumatin family protein [Pseudosporangium ferrugineum]|uniref:Ricin-type beta-trefoil lectin protein n=1 Tax=Pseudosporangium ferrugineum TaxID=439699 RepID=A0A2T0S3B9_9ACTN|nr:thaumatin family protein [Pseudosporangium ferrugineum]PRY27914.1 ricin-type beta-trefoil lectin protein [Pseudosporangium ferrugineum]